MKKEELIGKLQMTYVGDRNAFNELLGYYDGLKQGIEELQQENEKLQKRIDKVIDKLTLLIDVGFDYDGFNKIESLKSLIDELVGYAIESREILEGEEND